MKNPFKATCCFIVVLFLSGNLFAQNEGNEDYFRPDKGSFGFNIALNYGSMSDKGLMLATNGTDKLEPYFFFDFGFGRSQERFANFDIQNIERQNLLVPPA